MQATARLWKTGSKQRSYEVD